MAPTTAGSASKRAKIRKPLVLKPSELTRAVPGSRSPPRPPASRPRRRAPGRSGRGGRDVITGAAGAERTQQRQVLADLGRIHVGQLGQLLGVHVASVLGQQLREEFGGRPAAGPRWPRGSASRIRRDARLTHQDRTGGSHRTQPGRCVRAGGLGRVGSGRWLGQADDVSGSDPELVGRRTLADHQGKPPVGVDDQAELPRPQLGERSHPTDHAIREAPRYVGVIVRPCRTAKTSGSSSLGTRSSCRLPKWSTQPT